MIESACGVALFAWSYAVAMTSLYGAGRAAWQRRGGGARRAIASSRPPGMAATGARNGGDRRQERRALVVRPCAGIEPELERALVSLSRARSRAEIACRIAVEGPRDPADAIAQIAAEALRRAGVDASVVHTAADAPNHKAAQIAAVLAAERRAFDAIVVADSDVDLEGFDLDALLAPLFDEAPEGRGRRPRAGAVWAPPVEIGAGSGAGDRASRALLAGSLHAFTILGALDRGGLVGKLFAARRDAIEAAGGFGALERVLGEDMELARRLASSGHAVRVAPVVARSLKEGRSWDDAALRYARWLAVIRAQRPHLLASYPLLFFATPLILAACALLAPFAPAVAIAAAVLAASSRLVVAAAARRLAGLAPSLRASISDAVLADALLAHAFARAITTRTVGWRGRTLTLDRRGRIRGGERRAVSGS